MREVLSEMTNVEEQFLGLAMSAVLTDTESKTLAQLYHEIGAKRVLAIVDSNRVGALVSVALGKVLAGVEGESFRAKSTKNEERVTRLLSGLTSVFDELARRDCLCAVVEGGGMLLGSSLPVAAFGAGDLDILTESGKQQDVTAAFEAAGFEEVRRRDVPGERREFRKVDTHGEMWINAGAVPFDRMWAPIYYFDRTHEWLSRRVPSNNKANAFVLKPEDALVFVCVHTSLHGYVRSPGLRLHVDVDRIVRDNSINWQAFLNELSDSNVRVRAYFSLVIASELLGTPIPDYALAELRPSKWRRGLFKRLIGEKLVLGEQSSSLRFPEMLALDIATSEATPVAWMKGVLLPPTEWVRERYPVESNVGRAAELHWKRITHLIKNRGF